MPVVARKSSSRLPIYSPESVERQGVVNNHTRNEKEKRKSSTLRRQPGNYNHKIIVYCLIIILITLVAASIVIHYNIPSFSFSTFKLHLSSSPSFLSRKSQYELFINQKQRIAICLPYLSSNHKDYGGPLFPPYFQLFLSTAKGSYALIDFFIFYIHNNSSYTEYLQTLYDIPPNVQLINLQNMTFLATLLSRVILLEDEIVIATTTKKQQQVIAWLETFLSLFPYLLVEYKPAYGYIFQDYFKTYSHWGYSDFDIVWGDMSRWITQDELINFDIVTYGFGDQHRLYLRGQFTFHKVRRFKRLQCIDTMNRNTDDDDVDASFLVFIIHRTITKSIIFGVHVFI